AIESGHLPVAEPQLDELFRRHRDLVTITSRASALETCDVVYVACDVPTDDAGASDLVGVSALIDTVVSSLHPDAVLVVLCQVPPGPTRGVGVPPPRRFYQVETLVFGRAIERALHPERIIVGCAEPDAPLPPAYATYLASFGCAVLPMRYE